MSSSGFVVIVLGEVPEEGAFDSARKSRNRCRSRPPRRQPVTLGRRPRSHMPRRTRIRAPPGALAGPSLSASRIDRRECDLVGSLVALLDSFSASSISVATAPSNMSGASTAIALVGQSLGVGEDVLVQAPPGMEDDDAGRRAVRDPNVRSIGRLAGVELFEFGHVGTSSLGHRWSSTARMICQWP